MRLLELPIRELHRGPSHGLVALRRGPLPEEFQKYCYALWLVGRGMQRRL